MQIVQTIEALREALRDARQPVFVPTMGNLHEGHLRLVREAPRWGDCCVVSLFVNRLQFLPHEDFDRYPRTLDDDLRALHTVPCAVAFAPTQFTNLFALVVAAEIEFRQVGPGVYLSTRQHHGFRSTGDHLKHRLFGQKTLV